MKRDTKNIAFIVVLLITLAVAPKLNAASYPRHPPLASFTGSKVVTSEDYIRILKNAKLGILRLEKKLDRLDDVKTRRSPCDLGSLPQTKYSWTLTLVDTSGRGTGSHNDTTRIVGGTTYIIGFAASPNYSLRYILSIAPPLPYPIRGPFIVLDDIVYRINEMIESILKSDLQKYVITYLYLADYYTELALKQEGFRVAQLPTFSALAVVATLLPEGVANDSQSLLRLGVSNTISNPLTVRILLVRVPVKSVVECNPLLSDSRLLDVDINVSRATLEILSVILSYIPLDASLKEFYRVEVGLLDRIFSSSSDINLIAGSGLNAPSLNSSIEVSRANSSSLTQSPLAFRGEIKQGGLDLEEVSRMIHKMISANLSGSKLMRGATRGSSDANSRRLVVNLTKLLLQAPLPRGLGAPKLRDTSASHTPLYSLQRSDIAVDPKSLLIAAIAAVFLGYLLLGRTYRLRLVALRTLRRLMLKLGLHLGGPLEPMKRADYRLKSLVCYSKALDKVKPYVGAKSPSETPREFLTRAHGKLPGWLYRLLNAATKLFELTWYAGVKPSEGELNKCLEVGEFSSKD